MVNRRRLKHFEINTYLLTIPKEQFNAKIAFRESKSVHQLQDGEAIRRREENRKIYLEKVGNNKNCVIENETTCFDKP